MANISDLITISEILEEASAVGMRTEVQNMAESYLTSDPTLDAVFVYRSTVDVLIDSGWDVTNLLDWEDLIF